MPGSSASRWLDVTPKKTKEFKFKPGEFQSKLENIIREDCLRYLLHDCRD
jgi:hypothetical protein